jgi:hypothetical protein
VAQTDDMRAGDSEVFQDLCSDLSNFGEIVETIAATIVRFERKGRVISGCGTELGYRIKVWHEHSLIGPQVTPAGCTLPGRYA